MYASQHIDMGEMFMSVAKKSTLYRSTRIYVQLVCTNAWMAWIYYEHLFHKYLLRRTFNFMIERDIETDAVWLSWLYSYCWCFLLLLLCMLIKMREKKNSCERMRRALFSLSNRINQKLLARILTPKKKLENEKKHAWAYVSMRMETGMCAIKT